MAKKINLFFVFFYILSTVSAATYTTTSTPGTYDIGGAPGATDDIIVNHDWSEHNAGPFGNYTGTMTINNGGFYHINGSSTTWTGAVITIANTGNLVISGDVILNTGLTMTNDGHFEVSGDLDNYVAFGGSGTYYVGGTTTPIGDGSFGSNTLGTLPVELLNFTAKSVNNTTILDWSTASEINNSHFEIQKSYDGKQFETIATVAGFGNSSELIDYNYVDENNQTAYYRLKQVDYDNKFEYSPIAYVKSKQASVSIIQNQSTNLFTINGNGTYQLSLYSVNGSLIFNETLFVEGTLKVNLPVNYQGVYLLQLENNFESISKKGIINL